MDCLELAKAVVKGTLSIIYYYALAIYRYFVPINKDVTGKVVLITGSGGGLGRLVAMKFGTLGCKVVLWDINNDQNEETARLVRLSSKKGAEAFPYICDVTDRANVYKTAEDVKKNIGPVDILINNAGIVQGRGLLDSDDEKIIKTFNVNALSNFWTCKAFLPEMIERNSGHIVTVSSVAGIFGSGELTDYCSSKFAAFGFHESLMLELLGKGLTGIKGSIICPFFIKTGMFDGVDPPFPLLEADYSAEKIVTSVLQEQELVVFPCYFWLLNILKLVTPVKAFGAIYMALNGPKIMQAFRGH